MSVLEQLQGGLPAPYSQDPLGLPALSITYNGTSCFAEIADAKLRLSVAGGTGHDLLVELRSYMLGQAVGPLPSLVDYLNDQPGYTATILPSFTLARGNLGLPISLFGAWALADCRQDLLGNPNLSIAQSVLWNVLMPIAAALRDSRAQVEAIVGNAQVDRATGLWLADAGDLYGVDRQNTETDDAYRRRIILELIAPRANNEAMRQIIKQAWGLFDVTIVDDLLPSPTNPLARLNPFHFYVQTTLQPYGGFTGSFAGLTDLVNRIKAWGTSWDPEVYGLNDDTRPPSLEGYPRRDIFLVEDDYLTEILDPSAMTRKELWIESTRVPVTHWLITTRPIDRYYGSLRYGQSYYDGTQKFFSDNPLNDGNFSRALIPTPGTRINPQLSMGIGGSNSGFVVPQPYVTQAPAYLLGPGRNPQAWVNTFQEWWQDLIVSVYKDEQRPPSTEAGITLKAISDEFRQASSDSFTEKRAILTQDTRTHPQLFRTQDWACRTQSRHARMQARVGTETEIGQMADYVQDFHNGVRTYLAVTH